MSAFRANLGVHENGRRPGFGYRLMTKPAPPDLNMPGVLAMPRFLSMSSTFRSESAMRTS